MGRPPLPLPNDEFDDGIVVASVWQDDDPVPNGATALLLLLRKEPPYYAVVDIEVRDSSWYSVNEESHPNINPATEAFAQAGGDY